MNRSRVLGFHRIDDVRLCWTATLILRQQGGFNQVPPWLSRQSDSLLSCSALLWHTRRLVRGSRDPPDSGVSECPLGGATSSQDSIRIRFRSVASLMIQDVVGPRGLQNSVILPAPCSLEWPSSTTHFEESVVELACAFFGLQYRAVSG